MPPCLCTTSWERSGDELPRLIPRRSHPESHSQTLTPRASFPDAHIPSLIPRCSHPEPHSQTLTPRASFPDAHTLRSCDVATSSAQPCSTQPTLPMSSASVYILNTNQRTKNGGGLGTRLPHLASSFAEIVLGILWMDAQAFFIQ